VDLAWHVGGTMTKRAKINIPETFHLFGSEYEVVFRDDLSQVEGLEGRHHYGLKKIELQSIDATHTRDSVEHAYFHELIHAILCQMSDEKNNDETFIDIFAGLLHQALGGKS